METGKIQIMEVQFSDETLANVHFALYQSLSSVLMANFLHADTPLVCVCLAARELYKTNHTAAATLQRKPTQLPKTRDSNNMKGVSKLSLPLSLLQGSLVPFLVLCFERSRGAKLACQRSYSFKALAKNGRAIVGERESLPPAPAPPRLARRNVSQIVRAACVRI